jgi:hypothetical protein
MAESEAQRLADAALERVHRERRQRDDAVWQAERSRQEQLARQALEDSTRQRLHPNALPPESIGSGRPLTSAQIRAARQRTKDRLAGVISAEEAVRAEHQKSIDALKATRTAKEIRELQAYAESDAAATRAANADKINRGQSGKFVKKNTEEE